MRFRSQVKSLTWADLIAHGPENDGELATWRVDSFDRVPFSVGTCFFRQAMCGLFGVCGAWPFSAAGFGPGWTLIV